MKMWTIRAIEIAGSLMLLFQTSLTAQQPDACATAAGRADTAAAEVCSGADSLRRADAATPIERARSLQAAADHFRRAATQARDAEIVSVALDQLAAVYDAKHLDEPSAMEQVLRELIALTPNDLGPVYRLALAQEERGLIEAAESTLLDARHRQPEAVEPNQRLAQFYARRVTALHKQDPLTSETVSNPGEPDAKGIYRVGSNLKPPHREGVPVYPEEARAAGIVGVVMAEVVIDLTGSVVDARVVRSIPMLDEAALTAVRTWKFEPTLVSGRPVPVRMVLSVNFSR
jgi:TonB family protein